MQNRINIREPPGIFTTRGFVVAPIFAPDVENARDFFDAVRTARRMFAVGRLIQVVIPVPVQGTVKRMTILETHFRNFNAMNDVLRRYLGLVEGVEGSDNLVAPGEPAPIPDYQNFDLFYSAVNENDFRAGVRAADAQALGVVQLPRIAHNALNVRPLGIKPHYRQNTPWIFQAEDGSHDPRFQGDGKCGEVVCQALGLPPNALLNADAKWSLTHLQTVYKETYGRDLLVVNVHKDAPTWIDASLDQDGFQLKVPKTRKNPALLFSLSQRSVVPLEVDQPVVLWDGDQHVAMARIDRRFVDGPRLLLYPNYFERGGDFFFIRPKNADSVKDPFTDTTVIPSLPEKTLHPSWVAIRSAPHTWEMRKQFMKTSSTRYGYVFWDLETVNVPGGLTVPYCISWLVVDVELDEDDHPIFPTNFSDFEAHTEFYYGEDALDHFIGMILEASFGRNGFGSYRELVGVTFNGSNFDHILLFEAFMAKPRQEHNSYFYGDFSISKEFFQGSALSSLCVEGYFHIFDIARHLPGSLAANCDAFSCENTKLGDFDHEAVQAVFEREGFDGLRDYAGPDLLPVGDSPDNYPDGNYPKFMTHLQQYAKRDSASLAELFFRYRSQNPLKIPGKNKKQVKILPPLTNASESYRFWEEYSAGLAYDTLEEELPLSTDDYRMRLVKRDGKPVRTEDGELTYEQIKIAKIHDPLPLTFLKEVRETFPSIVAGRTQLFHIPQWTQEPCVSMDVKSLYPYVMCVKDVYYPAGQASFLPESLGPAYLRNLYHNDPRLGLWFVDVDQSCLPGKNLPYILASKIPYQHDEILEMYGLPRPQTETNDWHSDEVRRIWITSEEIRVLLKFGCEIYFRSAILFAGRIKSVDLFGNLATLMKVKNGEDAAKAEMKKVLKRVNNDKTHPDYLEAKSKYNPALRQNAKTASNSIFGKMLESFHPASLLPMDMQKYERIRSDIIHEKSRYEDVNVLYPFGNRVYARVRKNVLWDGFLDKQHPAQIGFYILAYARMFMYEYAYAPLGLDQCLYTDTDAIKTTKRAFEEKLKPLWASTLIPHWPETEAFEPRYATEHLYEDDCRCYGGFENELKDNGGLVTVAKKMWLIVPPGTTTLMENPNDSPNPDEMVYTKLDPDACKCGMKGVGKKDILLTNEQYELLTAGLANSGSLVWRTLCIHIFSDKSRTIANNLGEFYARLLYHQEAHVLRSNFQKHVSQHARNVTWGDTEKHVQNFSALTHRFSIASLRPSKNQEVRELVPEYYDFA